MSARLKRNWELLKLLKKTKGKERRNALIYVGKQDLIRAICEIIHNVLLGTVKLKPTEIKRLKRYKSVLRQLADRKVAVKTKEDLVKQRGGFLPLILGPALGVVASLIGEVIGKAI